MAEPHTQIHLDAGYFERLFQSSGFAIVSCRPDGIIAAWNTAAEKLFCDDGSCLDGNPITAIFPKNDRDNAREQFQLCVRSLERVEFQTRLAAAAAQPLVFAVLLTPVPGDDGSLGGVAVWFRDITTRVRLQRTVDKQKRLNLLGELAGAVAHHYNNLLCSIATSVEYAANMNTMTATRRALRRTNEAVSRAAGITQQLLAFAQADYRSCDLSDLTETFLLFFDEAEPRLTSRNINLNVNWDNIPYATVMREPLRVALNNLVENAIEIMPGGGTLTAELLRHDDTHARISIADTGGGISRDDMEHLFEPFHTTKGASGAPRNPGLGLSVAHGLIAEMHGTITAANISGHGARFDIILPLNSQ